MIGQDEVKELGKVKTVSYLMNGQQERFVSRMPIFNEKKGRYVFNFYGRALESSVKNVQLVKERDLELVPTQS